MLRLPGKPQGAAEGGPKGNHGPGLETSSTHLSLFSSKLVSNSFSETEEAEYLFTVHKVTDENTPVCVGEFYLKDKP